LVNGDNVYISFGIFKPNKDLMSYMCENFLYIMKIQDHVKKINLIKDLAKVYYAKELVVQDNI
jgi:hypothetical protein